MDNQDHQKHYPLKFTLDDGTHVEVNNAGNNQYNFSMTRKGGIASNFSIVNDDRPKEQIEKGLNFDQLDALRRFWLETDNLI